HASGASHRERLGGRVLRAVRQHQVASPVAPRVDLCAGGRGERCQHHTRDENRSDRGSHRDRRDRRSLRQFCMASPVPGVFNELGAESLAACSETEQPAAILRGFPERQESSFCNTTGAAASNSPILEGSLPPASAKSGRPPPPPPTIGASSLTSRP